MVLIIPSDVSQVVAKNTMAAITTKIAPTDNIVVFLISVSLSTGFLASTFCSETRSCFVLELLLVIFFPIDSRLNPQLGQNLISDCLLLF